MKIVMYWHNGRSLGHTAEVSKVANALASQIEELNLVGVSGTSKGLDMLPSKMDVVKLPSFSNYDTEQGLLFETPLGIKREELFNIRKNIITSFFETYDFDVFIANHEPYGLDRELESALTLDKDYLRILTLRGVLFDKEETNKEYFSREASEWINNNYDAIFVHTDPNIFSLEKEYDIPSKLVEKIVYTGYLAESSLLSKEYARHELGMDLGERNIVASMGGGQGAIKIWLSILESLKQTQDEFDKAYIITGPYLEKEDFQLLKKLEDEIEYLSVINYINNMDYWMTASDVFIGAGGSNMIGEILSTRTNSIVIPRQISESEQLIHSRLLEKKGYMRVCDLIQLQNGELTDILLNSFNNPIKMDLGDLMMNGVNTYAEKIFQCYSKYLDRKKYNLI